MEPEALAPYGYEVHVPDSSGVRDKLDKSANSSTMVGALSMRDRRINGIAVSLMFVLATGQAPMRAAASQEMESATTTTTTVQYGMMSTAVMLLLTFTPLVTAVYNSSRMSQQQKQQTQDQSTQNAKTPNRKIDAIRVRESEEEEDSTQDGTAGQSQVQSRNRDNTRDVKYVARRKSSLSSHK
eukprot:5816909-Amphidinium_carterae.2